MRALRALQMVPDDDRAEWLIKHEPETEDRRRAQAGADDDVAMKRDPEEDSVLRPESKEAMVTKQEPEANNVIEQESDGDVVIKEGKLLQASASRKVSCSSGWFHRSRRHEYQSYD